MLAKNWLAPRKGDLVSDRRLCLEYFWGNWFADEIRLQSVIGDSVNKMMNQWGP